MAVRIGQALLRRLVADKAQLPLKDVEKVLDAYNDVVVSMLDTGAKVGLPTLDGYLVKIEKKATRRRAPGGGPLVEVPARKRIVFRETRKR